MTGIGPGRDKAMRYETLLEPYSHIPTTSAPVMISECGNLGKHWEASSTCGESTAARGRLRGQSRLCVRHTRIESHVRPSRLAPHRPNNVRAPNQCAPTSANLSSWDDRSCATTGGGECDCSPEKDEHMRGAPCTKSTWSGDDKIEPYYHIINMSLEIGTTVQRGATEAKWNKSGGSRHLTSPRNLSRFQLSSNRDTPKSVKLGS